MAQEDGIGRQVNDYHREAERLWDRASSAQAEGRLHEADDLYGQAAKAEEAALSKVGEGKVRTRSVLSVSVASLLYKARRLGEAELRIVEFLGPSTRLEKWADRQLRELLQVVLDERKLVESRASEKV